VRKCVRTKWQAAAAVVTGPTPSCRGELRERVERSPMAELELRSKAAAELGPRNGNGITAIARAPALFAGRRTARQSHGGSDHVLVTFPALQ
jgi:hypothetical protein